MGGKRCCNCNEFQSLALTGLYRLVVGICRILDRLHICCDRWIDKHCGLAVAVGYSGIPTQSENATCQGATSNRLYSSSIFHGTTRSPIAVRLDGLRKDCCGFCQEVERVGSDPICAGSLCLKVLHCNQSQSLTLTTLYRHTVKFCRIVDRLHICCDPWSSSIVPPLFVLFGFRIV